MPTQYDNLGQGMSSAYPLTPATSALTPVADAKVGGQAPANDPSLMANYYAGLNAGGTMQQASTSAGQGQAYKAPAPATTTTTPPPVVTPPAATSTTSSSSDAAAAAKQSTLDDLQAQQAKIDSDMAIQRQSEIDASTQRIQDQYAQQQEALKASQGEESATSQALQFKLGREATPYAQAEKEKLATIQNQRITDLTNAQSAAIAAATQAINDNDFKLANQKKQEAQSLFDDRMKIVADQRAQTAADYTQAQQKAQTAATMQTTQQNLINGQSDYAATLLTNNPTSDLAAMQKLVDQNPALGSAADLYSAALAKKQANQDKNKPYEMNVTTNASTGVKTTTYGIIDPVTGQMHQVQMDGNQPPEKVQETLNAGGSLYTLPSGKAIALDPSDLAFISNLTPQDIRLGEDIANYKAPLNQVVSLRGQERTKFAELAALIDPNFDITNYTTVQQARKSFASGGKDSSNIASLNTAVLHLSELKHSIADLKNNGFVAGNAIGNWLNKQTGGTNTSAFNTASQGVAGEMAKVFKGTGGTDAEISKWQNDLNSSSSPEQINKSIDTMLNLMNGRLEAIKGTYQSSFNTDPPANLLLNKSTVKTLETLDPNNNMGWKDLTQQNTDQTQAAGGYASKIDEAKLNGHNPDEIVQALLKDPSIGSKIQTALDLHYSADDILNKVRNFNQPLSMGQNGSIQLGSHLAQVNNNPGNLRFVGQPGAVQGTGGFAKFSSPEAGLQAMKTLLTKYSSSGDTLASMINKYAPPSENDTNTYVSQMAKALGVDPNTPLSKIDLDKLTKAMAQKESSSIIS